MASLIIVEPPLFFEGGERRKVALIRHAIVVLEQRQAVKAVCGGKRVHILHSGGLVVWKMAADLCAEVRGSKSRIPRDPDSTQHTKAVLSKVEAAMADKSTDMVVLFDQVASTDVFQRLSGKTRKLSPGEVVMVDEEGVVTMLISRSPD